MEAFGVKELPLSQMKVGTSGTLAEVTISACDKEDGRPLLKKKIPLAYVYLLCYTDSKKIKHLISFLPPALKKNFLSHCYLFCGSQWEKLCE